MSTTFEIRDLGAPLAVGNTAEVYAWETGWVLKLFFARFDAGSVAYEQRLAKAIARTTLPAPAVGEIVKIGDRHGLLYQRCEGVSMGDELGASPQRLADYANQLADLHTALHTKYIDVDIPLMRERLVFKLNDAKTLPATLRRAALDALAVMPDGDRLCHGDFHPGNILIHKSQPVIIDWIDSSIGNPLADVARTSILVLGFAAVQAAPEVGTAVEQFHETYLRRYFQIHPGGEEEYRRWLPIVAAARISEGITELEPWLQAQAGMLLE